MLVTTPSDVTYVTVWPITFTPNPRVLKIEKWKNKSKENKMRKKIKKLSLQSSILILGSLSCNTLLFSVDVRMSS